MAIRNLRAIETSTQPGSVALMSGKKEIVEMPLEEEAFQGSTLAPVIDRLLSSQGMIPQDIHMVVLGRGPGSYTGLRVGCSLAFGFAYAVGCDSMGVSSFAALAGAEVLEGEELRQELLVSLNFQL